MATTVTDAYLHQRLAEVQEECASWQRLRNAHKSSSTVQAYVFEHESDDASLDALYHYILENIHDNTSFFQYFFGWENLEELDLAGDNQWLFIEYLLSNDYVLFPEIYNMLMEKLTAIEWQLPLSFALSHALLVRITTAPQQSAKDRIPLLEKNLRVYVPGKVIGDITKYCRRAYRYVDGLLAVGYSADDIFAILQAYDLEATEARQFRAYNDLIEDALVADGMTASQLPLVIDITQTVAVSARFEAGHLTHVIFDTLYDTWHPNPRRST